MEKGIKISETLTHQNLISGKGHSRGVGKHSHLYFIFTEHVDCAGELFDQVIDRGANTMSEEIARGFICQMLDGVAYCHLAGVAHRELCLENVLLTKEGRVKLLLLDLVHVYPRLADGTIDRSKPLKDACGSKSYVAPEVLAAKGYDGFAADIWSLGVCLFSMLSGFFPLDEASGNDWRYGKLVEAQKGGRSTTHVVYSWYRRKPSLSPEVVHLLDGLLNIDPNKRLTMAEIREHPWINAKKFDVGGAGGSGSGSVPDALPVLQTPEKLVKESDHKAVPLLMALDDQLAAVLASGAIKLIRADFMKQTAQPHLLRRQDLEALERDEQIAVFLKPDEAVALLRSNSRGIAALTYGWVTPDHPDETDEYLANMRRFLNHPARRAHRRLFLGFWLPSAEA